MQNASLKPLKSNFRVEKKLGKAVDGGYTKFALVYICDKISFSQLKALVCGVGSLPQLKNENYYGFTKELTFKFISNYCTILEVVRWRYRRTYCLVLFICLK